ncbi:hypothetical protein HDU87_005982 [Geranomyces variabilis]|uniref:Uncharacterized protein n=1 Tax=Geranomyces variabilis TaxID=109894 RepID=A0AAD5XV62_9FUNG|nr:hypothetical protein HDU87_005982 [Geranomyces variabilis]
MEPSRPPLPHHGSSTRIGLGLGLASSRSQPAIAGAALNRSRGGSVQGSESNRSTTSGTAPAFFRSSSATGIGGLGLGGLAGRQQGGPLIAALLRAGSQDTGIDDGRGTATGTGGAVKLRNPELEALVEAERARMVKDWVGTLEAPALPAAAGKDSAESQTGPAPSPPPPPIPPMNVRNIVPSHRTSTSSIEGETRPLLSPPDVTPKLVPSGRWAGVTRSLRKVFCCA